MGRRFVQRLWARRPARGAKWVGRGSGVAFAEAVEPRLLLSGAGDLSPQPGGEVTTIHWHGQETKALAGQWILRSDPQARTRLAEGPLDRVRRFVKARRPDVAVVDDLGTPGLSLLKAPPEVSFDKLARSLRSIPGFRSLQPDLVCAEISARLRQRQELRWLVDRVGQPGRRGGRKAVTRASGAIRACSHER